MLTKIGLENFKSWKKLDIDLAPITMLFGTNSSGKTSVLQSLLLLKQTVNSFDRKQHINFGGGERDYVDFGSYQDLVYGHDEENGLRISLNWLRNMIHPQDQKELGKGIELPLSYKAIWKKLDKTIHIEELSYSTTRDFWGLPLYMTAHLDGKQYDVNVSSPYSVIGVSISKIVQSCYILPDLTLMLHNQDNNTYIEKTFYMRYFEDLIDNLAYLGPLRQFPARYYLWTGSLPGIIEPDGGNTIQTLISSEKQSNDILQNVAEWIVKLGLVDEFKVITSNDRFYEPKIVIEGAESALVDVGFGVSQVLPVITMLFSAPEGSIILLEQPELHLHPNAQAILADLMLYVAEKRNLQLIVESHSEHLLRRLQRRIAEVEQEFANPDNIKMYFCEPGKEGSTIQEVEVDKYGQIANWPPNFFGDVSGDLDKMTDAALQRRRQELTGD